MRNNDRFGVQSNGNAMCSGAAAARPTLMPSLCKYMQGATTHAQCQALDALNNNTTPLSRTVVRPT